MVSSDPSVIMMKQNGRLINICRVMPHLLYPHCFVVVLILLEHDITGLRPSDTLFRSSRRYTLTQEDAQIRIMFILACWTTGAGADASTVILVDIMPPDN